MTDDAFIKALDQESAIQAAMLNGDPGPLINHWADRDDITVFGGWGRTEKGHKPVTDAMRGAGRRVVDVAPNELHLRQSALLRPKPRPGEGLR